MKKFEQAISRYKKSFAEKLSRENINEPLLRAIAQYLGPSIYSRDASKVACAKSQERNSIKVNFLVKKLGLKDSPELDDAIKEVCQTMGSSNRTKYRAVFYYLLVEKYNKQDLFLTEEVAEKKSKTARSNQSKSSTSKKDQPKDSGSSRPNGKEKSRARNMNPEMIIERHALYAGGAGLVPIPLIDLVTITTVQYNMIKKLAQQYDHVSFDSTRAQSLIASFMGGVGSFEVGIFSRIFFKGIPVIGPLVGGAATASFAYFTTKAIGDLFDDHFKSGGDMSIEERTIQKMKEYFNFEMKGWKKKSA